MDILIATTNQGKVKEYRDLLEPLGHRVESLLDFPDLPDVDETATSFLGNARLKASTISFLTGRMVIADDSGIMVDVLGGEPGVYSARWAGEGTPPDVLCQKLLDRLEGVPFEERTARYHTSIVAARIGGENLEVSAEWDGHIGLKPKGDQGFGYDPIFVVDGIEDGITAAQMSLEEKNQISQRKQAMDRLLEQLPDWIK